MANIVCDCAAGLVLAKFPCKSEDYGYPTKLLLQDPDGTLTVAGDCPTLAEIQAGIAAAGEDKVVVIERITNGQRIEAEREEESGADTADGLTDTFSINYTVTGNVKLLDETVRAELAALNCQSRLRLWIITSKGWLFGGATGYIVSGVFPQVTMEGFGTKPYVPLSFTYSSGLNCTDPACQDEGFLTLTNP